MRAAVKNSARFRQRLSWYRRARPLRVAGVPGIFGHADFLARGFFGERRQRRTWVISFFVFQFCFEFRNATLEWHDGFFHFGGSVTWRNIFWDIVLGTPPQRLQQPFTTTVLVVVQPERLLARVALRRRVGLVATDRANVPSSPRRISTPQLHSHKMHADGCHAASDVVAASVIGGPPSIRARTRAPTARSRPRSDFMMERR